ncbi:sensor histidine kinase [Colidextribacter sp. OB.20]|uniref:sensor histidine kinase n=1 Tax=Colidextribacter sp. OB.20 TaxID=2304568 RepID=UPI00136D972A|nr:HAMP domain-containing sensor histidine kinase [Colidextribacter sp. OB.20]NBI11142.1 sensor histidine kinase [Colidextribacter sp. OB.20]
MAKPTRLQDQVKIRGIRRRWLLNSVAIILLILALAVGAFAAMLWSYYYDGTKDDLSRKATSMANGFRMYTRTDYRAAAQQAVSSYEDKGRLELQFLDTTGTVLYSGSDLTAGSTPSTPEIQQAMGERTVRAWRGRDPDTKERILTASSPVIYQGEVVGVIRYVTSLSNIDRQFVFTMTVIAAIALAIFAMVYFSNLYFVRSIVEPLAGITEIAQVIAGGSYGVQIEKKYDDEIGELTDAINDMSLKIRQSEKTQSEFISSVSHELRTPLTAITGWAETIQNGECRSAADIRKGMEIIVSESKRLGNMVEELLEFSRIEDGRFTLSVEPLDLKAELEDAVYTYTEFFRKEGITLEYTDGPEEMLPISGDPERLRQVFCNLLDNAAKHGGAGKRIHVTLFKEGAEAAIRIRDYGPGAPEEELPFLKNRFYKGSSKARGSGIGLAVCEEIVTRHEGTMEVGNAEGGGFLVTIRLPLES